MNKIKDILTWLTIFLGIKKKELEELTPPVAPKIPPSEHLYNVAVSFLGTDVSPFDKADDELGCAESVTTVINVAFGDFPTELATWILKKKLSAHPKFQSTLDLDIGNVILSPTFSGNGSIRGHVGIIGKDKKIMSANSADGIWGENYTIDTWVKRYRNKGGLPIFVFKRIT